MALFLLTVAPGKRPTRTGAPRGRRSASLNRQVSPDGLNNDKGRDDPVRQVSQTDKRSRSRSLQTPVVCLLRKKYETKTKSALFSFFSLSHARKFCEKETGLTLNAQHKTKFRNKCVSHGLCNFFITKFTTFTTKNLCNYYSLINCSVLSKVSHSESKACFVLYLLFRCKQMQYGNPCLFL